MHIHFQYYIYCHLSAMTDPVYIRQACQSLHRNGIILKNNVLHIVTGFKIARPV